ncbi:MAG TPA: transaldolase [Nocardioidaceae bacterium]|nr:transaldolase [Nocardioidaceae bacterium]
MNDRLKKLSDAGVAIWLDDISRERLRTGQLTDLRDHKHLVGVTSNPTIFSKAVTDADEYAEQVHDLAVRGVGLEEAVRMITTYDVRWGCDVLQPVHDATDGLDGRVSLEVDPGLAHDSDATQAEAKALWWLVDRPNLFIKIPATKAGLGPITATIAQGMSVNVTLIFSLDRYAEVMEAYVAGLEQARENGHDVSTIHSVASFFVSRVDTEVDKRLDKIGGEEAAAMKSKAAVANARLAYQRFEQTFTGDRWEALAAAGAHKQRPLWASTSVKDPDLPDTMYVEELVAPGVVNTMPEATLEAFGDHGEVRGDPADTVTGNYQDAQSVLDRLGELGVDYDDVVQVLEDEGVEKFEASWKELLDTVSDALDAAKKDAQQ